MIYPKKNHLAETWSIKEGQGYRMEMLSDNSFRVRTSFNVCQVFTKNEIDIFFKKGWSKID